MAAKERSVRPWTEPGYAPWWRGGGGLAAPVVLGKHNAVGSGRSGAVVKRGLELLRVGLALSLLGGCGGAPVMHVPVQVPASTSPARVDAASLSPDDAKAVNLLDEAEKLFKGRKQRKRATAWRQSAELSLQSVTC